MGAKKYRIGNETKDSALISSVTVIDASNEPLKVLRVLVEGLAANEEAGLWLKNLSGIPMVPRISPFDIVYLDEDERVVTGVELLPVGDFPKFKRPAVSALVLPFQSLSSSKTQQGDQLIFTEIEDGSSETTEEHDEATAGDISKLKEHVPEAQPELPSVVEPVAGFQLDRSPLNHRIDVPGFDQEVVVELDSTDHPSIEGPSDPEEPADEPVAVSVTTSPVPEGQSADLQVEASPGIDDSASYLVREKSGKPHDAIQDPEVKADDDTAAGEKEWMVSRFLRWLYPAAYETDRRRGRRIPIPDLVAYDLSVGAPHALEVGDISSSGVFLVTQDHWEPGTLICLSIQREGPMESNVERRVLVQAEPVRWSKDGVGMSFVLPPGMDLRLWERPAKGDVRRSQPEYVLREFRLARALAFLGRISPTALDESKRLLQDELSNVRAGCMVNVALKAEERLVQEKNGASLLGHPDLIARIVQGASWADTEMMQDLWAGLLVSSCSNDGHDDSNLVFINLLSQLALLQIKLLCAICEKASTVVSGSQPVPGERIFSTSDDLIQMTGTHDLLKIHRSVAQLAEFGLLEKSVRASFVSEKEGATTTPTTLGMQLYARCLGLRENL
jgi:hypothetical protein